MNGNSTPNQLERQEVQDNRNKFTWWINTGGKRDIVCHGSTIEQAVENYGKYHPKNKIDGCGLLVQVTHRGILSYWSGEKFLEHLTRGMNNGL